MQKFCRNYKMKTMKIFLKTKFIFSIIFCTTFFSTLISCNKKNAQEQIPVAAEKIVNLEKKNSPFEWFCLTRDGFEKVERPQKTPAIIKKPWTEALRISYMAQAAENSPLDIDAKSAPKVFALVNHLGVISLGADEIKVYKDDSIFTNRSAEKIVFMNGTPIISVYKNSFFNEKISAHEKFRPFLVQFAQDSGVFFPILTYENLALDEKTQVNDFCWNGTQWFCSTKSSDENETKFEYLKFRPETALLSISPERNFISIEESTEDEFRAYRRPQEFSYAPERVKELLKYLPTNFNFYAECKIASGPTPREYLHGKVSGGAMRKATVQISDTWVAALFEDGTVFLNGALYGQKILNGGKPIALRLPKLPDGYVYFDFGISGTQFFAAWEECEFFETGRAGFIKVDLAKILY